MSRSSRVLYVLVGLLFLALLLPPWLSPDQPADAGALGAGFLAVVLLLHSARTLSNGELAALAMLAVPGLVGVGEAFGQLPVGPAALLALQCLLTLILGHSLGLLAGMLLPRRAGRVAGVALSLGVAALYAWALAPAGWTVSAALAALSLTTRVYVRRVRDRGRS